MRVITIKLGKTNLPKKQKKQGVKVLFKNFFDVRMNLQKGWNKAEVKTQEDYPTMKKWWKTKRYEDYTASVACTSNRCRVISVSFSPCFHTSNRSRVIFMSFPFRPCFCSGVVFLCFHLSLVSIFFIASSLNLKIFYRKFLLLVPT